jgi:hypothetical protein
MILFLLIDHDVLFHDDKKINSRKTALVESTIIKGKIGIENLLREEKTKGEGILIIYDFVKFKIL